MWTCKQCGAEVGYAELEIVELGKNGKLAGSLPVLIGGSSCFKCTVCGTQHHDNLEEIAEWEEEAVYA